MKKDLLSDIVDNMIKKPISYRQWMNNKRVFKFWNNLAIYRQAEMSIPYRSAMDTGAIIHRTFETLYQENYHRIFVERGTINVERPIS